MIPLSVYWLSLKTSLSFWTSLLSHMPPAIHRQAPPALSPQWSKPPLAFPSPPGGPSRHPPSLRSCRSPQVTPSLGICSPRQSLPAQQPERPHNSQEVSPCLRSEHCSGSLLLKSQGHHRSQPWPAGSWCRPFPHPAASGVLLPAPWLCRLQLLGPPCLCLTLILTSCSDVTSSVGSSPIPLFKIVHTTPDACTHSKKSCDVCLGS